MNQSIVTTLLLVPVDTGFVSSYSCVMRTAKPRGVNGLSREQVLGAMCVCVFSGVVSSLKDQQIVLLSLLYDKVGSFSPPVNPPVILHALHPNPAVS